LSHPPSDILLSRVYAVWNRSRHIFLICLCGYILNVGLYIGSSAYLVTTSRAITAPLPFTGCQLSPSFRYEYASIIVSIIFETMVILLIIIKSYPIVRLRGVKAPLYSLLFEDGVAFYCAILVAQVLILFCILSPSLVTFPILGSSLSIFIIGVACNRLLLRSQRLLQNRGSGLPTSFTSHGLVSAAGITVETHNQDNPHMASYSAGENLELANTRQEAQIHRESGAAALQPSLSRHI